MSINKESKAKETLKKTKKKKVRESAGRVFSVCSTVTGDADDARVLPTRTFG